MPVGRHWPSRCTVSRAITRPASSEAISSASRVPRPPRTSIARRACRPPPAFPPRAPRAGDAARLGGEQPGQARQVGEHVDGHRAEPQDERGLVQQHPRALARAGNGEHHPGAEDASGQQHDDRPEQAQQQRGRSLAPVRLAPAVVADEPVDHRPGLEGDRAEQQHAEEEVQGEQPADPQDREALDGQQDQQHRPGHRGQPLVPFGPAELPGTLSRLGLPQPPGRLGWPRWPLAGAPGIRPIPPVPVLVWI